MKTKLLTAIVFCFSGLLFAQSAEVIVKIADSTLLKNKALKYAFYDNLLRKDTILITQVQDTLLHRGMITNMRQNKFKRDSIYFDAIAFKHQKELTGTSKSKLDEWFPSDHTKIGVEKKKATEKALDRFMYLNAVDFDFADTKAGYVGHLNFYKPCKKKFGFGWNAGILKINYSNTDSLTRYSTDNVLLTPLDNVGVGSQYTRQYNSYKNKIKNTTYSLYMQSLFKITNEKNKNMIFIHAHAELLISRLVSTTEIHTLYQDTITVSNLDEIPQSSIDYLNQKQIHQQTFISGNFGGGVTYDLHFNDSSSLFFQGTVGYTSNYPHAASVNTTDPSTIVYRKNNSFYLVRSYYRQAISEEAELIIATDIRGLFPQYDPYYSIYAGLNISVKKIADLFK